MKNGVQYVFQVTLLPFTINLTSSNLGLQQLPILATKFKVLSATILNGRGKPLHIICI